MLRILFQHLRDRLADIAGSAGNRDSDHDVRGMALRKVWENEETLQSGLAKREGRMEE